MPKLFERSVKNDDGNDSPSSLDKPFWTDKHIGKTLKILEIFYLTSGILLILSAIGIGIMQPSEIILTLPALAMALIVCFSFYYGFKRRGGWIVPVMIFFSSVAIIRLLFYQPIDVVAVFLRILGFAFQLFILYFFTRKEVRNYFKSKESFIV